MQFVGLASAALLTPPAFWGWRLLTRRRLERPRLKAGLCLIGVVAAAALASLLPTPGKLAAATGLGGVARRRRSGDPASCLSGLALGDARPWRRLSPGSQSSASPPPRERAAQPARPMPMRPSNRPERPAPRRRRGSTKKRTEDEPSLGMVSIGAVIHALLAAKGALRRMARGGPGTARKSSSIPPAPPPALSRALVRSAR